MAVVQTTSAQGSAATLAVTWPYTTTTGNLIFVQVATGADASVTSSSVTDSQSNTYTLIGTKQVNGNKGLYVYYARNITGGTTPTVTVTFSASGQNNAVQVREYNGMDTSTSVLDQQAGNTGTSTTPTATTSGATTNAYDLIVGAFLYGGSTTFTSGTGFGAGVQYSTGASTVMYLEDKTVTVTGTQTANATVGGSGLYCAFAVAFRMNGTPPVVIAGPMMMGV